VEFRAANRGSWLLSGGVMQSFPPAKIRAGKDSEEATATAEGLVSSGESRAMASG